MSPLKRSPLPPGFTLVEVLVALVVLSIISGLSWQAVDGMIRSRDTVSTTLQRSLTLNTVLAQWEQDLQSAMSESPVPAVHFDGARLRIVRSRPDGAQLVVWSLRQGVWQRWASTSTSEELALTTQWSAVPSMTGREPGHVTLAEGVEGWQLYFFRGTAWANAQSAADLVSAGVAAATGASGASAPAAVRERLPQGVRLVLTLGAAGGGTLTRDVLVPGGTP